MRALIELTVKELIDSIEPFKELLNLKLNGRTAYLLGRIMREVDKEYSNFQNTRNKLIEKYEMKDENGNRIINQEGNVSIALDKIDNFNQELMDILQTKIEICADTINLADIEQFEFTPQQIMILMPFIKE